MTESKEIDICRILDMLPHRYPFLLIDRVLDYQLESHLTAIKNVTINEPCFQGHYPGLPTFPGVLIIEALAQSSAILVSMSPLVEHDQGKKVIFLLAGVDHARFKRPVVPGDQLVIKVELVHCKRRIWRHSATATVDGNLVASADIIFTYKLAESGSADG